VAYNCGKIIREFVVFTNKLFDMSNIQLGLLKY